jgi:hypothetical protein
MRTTVVAACVLLGAYLVLQRVMRLYTLLGIPLETELPDWLGRPVHLGGAGQVLQGIVA